MQALGVALLATCWRLNDVIPYVEGWKALAAAAIKEADAFIMMATRASLLQSEPCRFEWELAAALNKPIIRLDVASNWGHLVPEHLAGQPSLVIAGSPDQYVHEVVRTLTAACDSTR